jgi:hypothetical protein
MMKNIGSRAEVFHGAAVKTPGGLKKKELVQDTDGRIKSKAASAAALERVKREGKKAMTNVFKPVKKGFKLQPKVGTKDYEKKIKKM